MATVDLICGYTYDRTWSINADKAEWSAASLIDAAPLETPVWIITVDERGLFHAKLSSPGMADFSSGPHDTLHAAKLSCMRVDSFMDDALRLSARIRDGLAKA